jgi:predicted MFS family arabinose efflux permease
LGAVLSSVYFASRFHGMSKRIAAACGFAISALAFLAAAFVSSFPALAALHVVAGAAAGCGLSMTHGTIGGSANPHRLFAICGAALGVLAIVFMAATPNLIIAFGGSALFKVFAGVMAVAALLAALSFPNAPGRDSEDIVEEVGHLRREVWFGIGGVSCMALTQAMMFSFVQNIGVERGYTASAVTCVLIGLGFVNLIPNPLAAFLEKRVSAHIVVLIGPIVQALLVIAITWGTGFVAYAAPTLVFAAVMIFTHNFAFGLLSKLDPTARALAGTPAMLMVGAAIGPVLGGVLVQSFGFGSLGIAAIVIAIVAVALFSQARAPSAATAAAKAA